MVLSSKMQSVVPVCENVADFAPTKSNQHSRETLFLDTVRIWVPPTGPCTRKENSKAGNIRLKGKIRACEKTRRVRLAVAFFYVHSWLTNIIVAVRATSFARTSIPRADNSWKLGNRDDSGSSRNVLILISVIGKRTVVTVVCRWVILHGSAG